VSLHVVLNVPKPAQPPRPLQLQTIKCSLQHIWGLYAACGGLPLSYHCLVLQADTTSATDSADWHQGDCGTHVYAFIVFTLTNTDFTSMS